MRVYKFLKIVLICILVIPFGIFFSGCSADDFSIKSIEYNRSEGDNSIYTVTYSDGESDEFVIVDGRKATEAVDGETPYIGNNGNWWVGSTDLGVKATGESGQDLTLEDVYNKYVEEYGQIEYNEFLDLYFKDVKPEDQTKAINRCLLTSVKLYTQFRETSYYSKKSAVYGGSGVIYKIQDDVTYILTNYHIIYDESANADNNGNYPQLIIGYLYGSESKYGSTGEYDADGYPIYDYSSYGIEMELVGGSPVHDIAILKAKTEDILAINPQVREVEFADNYHVGETAIAIGNALGEGISVTVGMVSVDNEITSLTVDDTARNYRSIRIETPIYHGSSGGGLFNSNGKLIGITNSGMEAYEQINYAIPVSIVKNVAENIMYYAFDGNDETNGAYKILLGCTVQGINSRYVYDSTSGYGTIKEDILIKELAENSISVEDLGLMVDDVIVSMKINEKTYQLNRNFEISDLILTLRAGDEITFRLKRGNSLFDSNSYTILETDLVKYV